MELYKTILLHDYLPYDCLSPRYESELNAPKLFYNPDSECVERQNDGEEVIVPTTSKEVNWEKVLFDLLLESAKPTPEDKEVPHEIMAAAFFEEKELLCENVVKHPSNKYTPIMDDLNVYESEFCPKNSIFFLPPAQYFGVFPETAGKRERGMAIINPLFVFHVECKP